MPIYEYVCLTCGHVLEAIHGMSAASPTTHEGCGGRLEKVPSTSGLRSKGNDGLTGSTSASMLRFHENTKLVDEKSRKRGR
jgi:putative FmdB family regulatory protein